jgi:hypothetical protein
MASGDWCDSRDPCSPSHHRGPPLARSRLRPIRRGGSPGYSRIDSALLRFGFQPRSVAPRAWPPCGSSPRKYGLIYRVEHCVQAISKLNGADPDHLAALVHGRHRRLRDTWTVCDWAFRCRAAPAAA